MSNKIIRKVMGLCVKVKRRAEDVSDEKENELKKDIKVEQNASVINNANNINSNNVVNINVYTLNGILPQGLIDKFVTGGVMQQSLEKALSTGKINTPIVATFEPTHFSRSSENTRKGKDLSCTLRAQELRADREKLDAEYTTPEEVFLKNVERVTKATNVAFKIDCYFWNNETRSEFFKELLIDCINNRYTLRSGRAISFDLGDVIFVFGKIPPKTIEAARKEGDYEESDRYFRELRLEPGWEKTYGKIKKYLAICEVIRHKEGKTLYNNWTNLYASRVPDRIKIGDISPIDGEFSAHTKSRTQITFTNKEDRFSIDYFLRSYEKDYNDKKRSETVLNCVNTVKKSMLIDYPDLTENLGRIKERVIRSKRATIREEAREYPDLSTKNAYNEAVSDAIFLLDETVSFRQRGRRRAKNETAVNVKAKDLGYSEMWGQLLSMLTRNNVLLEAPTLLNQDQPAILAKMGQFELLVFYNSQRFVAEAVRKNNNTTK